MRENAIWLPFWALLLGGVNVHFAGREPQLLYADVILFLLLLYLALWEGFYPSLKDWIPKLGAFVILSGVLSALVNYRDVYRSIDALKILGVGLLVYAIAKKTPIGLLTLSLWGAIAGILLLGNYQALRYGEYEGVAGLKDEIGIVLGRSNYVASMLLILIPLSVASVSIHKGKKRWLCAGCAMLMLGGLVATMSRGAMLALVLATILSVPLLYKAGMRTKHAAIVALVLALVVALLPSDLLATNVALFAYRLDNPDLTREEIMKASWETFKENPVLGIGPGQLGPAIAHHVIVPMYGGIYYNAHNLILDALAEDGLPAGLALLTMVGIVLWKALNALLAQPNPLNAAVWLGLLAAVLHNMVEASFEGQQFQYVFWAVAAMAGRNWNVGGS